MVVNKTSISAGEIIRQILEASPAVMERARKVYPVIEDNATLPYVVYRRTSLSQTGPPKLAKFRAYSATIEVLCMARNYTDSVDLAEAVAAALDGARCETDGGLTLYSSELVNGEETWIADAYVQSLIFEIRIQ